MLGRILDRIIRKFLAHEDGIIGLERRICIWIIRRDLGLALELGFGLARICEHISRFCGSIVFISSMVVLL